MYVIIIYIINSNFMIISRQLDLSFLDIVTSEMKEVTN